MVILNVAYSEPVNCSDPSTLTLTQEQIWKGLELKARRPQVFIPSFDDSRVLEERENGCYILREAHVASNLRESPMAGKWTREECRLHKPVMRALNLLKYDLTKQSHFTLPNGSIIQNILSMGPDQVLYLTFTYQWNFPNIEPGTPEAEKTWDDHMKIAISSVQGTIKALRKMAEEHEL